MTKRIIAFAAAAALGIGTLGGVSRAADETNRTGATAGNNLSGTSQTGQTGAANQDRSGAGGSTGAGVSGSGATGAAGASGTAGASGAAGTSGTYGASGTAGASGTSSNNAGPVGGEFAIQGQGSDQDIHAAIQSANDPDKLFLVCAAIDNQCEMQFAEIAQNKAQDQKVKDFARKMLQDHQQADRQLREAAQESGVTLPRGLPMIKQHELKVFQSLNGKDFDQQFISKMRAAHAKAVNEYQDVAQLAKNDQIKQFASKTLPTLQQHYQDAQQTATALGLSSGMEAQPAGARMPGSSGGTNR